MSISVTVHDKTLVHRGADRVRIETDGPNDPYVPDLIEELVEPEDELPTPPPNRTAPEVP